MSAPRKLDEFVARARSLSRRALLDAAAVEVIAAFEGAGLRPILLKGPALVHALYEPDESRGYSDVDVLVGPEDLPQARGALAERGYRHASEIFGIDDVAGVVHAETWSRGVPGHRSGGPLLVDLHWRLAGCGVEADAAWRILDAAHRAELELNGHHVSVLDQSGLALHVATHAAQHGPGELKAMGDLERAIERWPAAVWRAAARLAGELGAMAAFAAGLRLTPPGAALAHDLGLPSTARVSWAIEHRDERPRGTFHVEALVRARGLRERLDVLRRSLFPTRKWIAWHYGWVGESRAKLGAAYAAHLLRSPIWAARAWRFRRRALRAGR